MIIHEKSHDTTVEYRTNGQTHKEKVSLKRLWSVP